MNKIDITQPNPYCEIRSSSRHGRGVFAKRDIPRGTVIALYAGVDIPIEEAHNYPISHASFNFGDRSKIRIGYENAPNEWEIGQLMNDYMVPQIEFPTQEITTDDTERIEMLSLAYEIINTRNVNTIIRNDMWMVAKRNILNGEEITNSYGHQYWLKYLFDKCPNILRRFQIFSILKPFDLQTMTESESAARLQYIGLMPVNSEKWLCFPNITATMTAKEKLTKIIETLNLQPKAH